jgi:hypothetical protein
MCNFTQIGTSIIVLENKTFQKKDTIDDSHHSSNREISPYRIENFVKMLHNFGISDRYINEISIGSQNDIPHLIRNVKFFDD